MRQRRQGYAEIPSRVDGEGGNDIEMQSVVDKHGVPLTYQGGVQQSEPTHLSSFTGDWALPPQVEPSAHNHNDPEFWHRRLETLLEFQAKLESAEKRAGVNKWLAAFSTSFFGTVTLFSLVATIFTGDWWVPLVVSATSGPLTIVTGIFTAKALDRSLHASDANRQKFVNLRLYHQPLQPPFERPQSQPRGEQVFVFINGQSRGPFEIDTARVRYYEQEETEEWNFKNVPNAYELMIRVLPIWIEDARQNLRRCNDLVQRELASESGHVSMPRPAPKPEPVPVVNVLLAGSLGRSMSSMLHDGENVVVPQAKPEGDPAFSGMMRFHEGDSGLTEIVVDAHDAEPTEVPVDFRAGSPGFGVQDN